MAYQRKTRDEWQILVNYGYGDGWEHEVSEDSYREARDQVRTYRENCPYPVKMRCKRVPIEQSQHT